ncbi:MAG: nicotinate phosphoribosyltransferase [Gammaproteobacteria bacterium]|nr:nicotinate phosphoribosyltransferase [Gammaproteobacteria bacterium]
MIREAALLTDLYQLTMLQAYHREDMHAEASFEFFVRTLPTTRNFLIAAGLEQLLDFLEGFQFSAEECEWLRTTGLFAGDFIDYLGHLRFTGAVHAMPEGTFCFPNEPIVRVTAPLPEAQIIETRLINLLQYQTMIASKAVRAVLAADGRTLVDFGLRRAHGAEAGLLAARASYLAGFSGTSNVLAGKCYGIPLFGTMAHSYVMAHDTEIEAFIRFAEALPEQTVLLIDTYDTLEAAKLLAQQAQSFASRGLRIRGVRLDSGDLAALSVSTREILDRGGLKGSEIFASGDLDEYAIRRLLAVDAPIDGFGVGTQLATSADAPALNCAYKLEEYAGCPRRKRSPGRATLPGRKQVFRTCDGQGVMLHDVLELCGAEGPGEPLLCEVMRGGRRLEAPEPLAAVRARVAEQRERLPRALASIDTAGAFPVRIGPALSDLAQAMEQSGR